MVARGDALALLYSPELVVTEQNLLDARRAHSSADLASATRRLELLGIDSEQIDAMLTRGKPNIELTIHSPISGHVIKKYVREGQYVQEGSPLYDIADLSTVWIQAQVYEDDLEFLPADQQSHEPLPESERLPIVATTRAFAGEPFHGTLAFIYPHVDQDTRTVSVRFELENPGHKLRPGSTATVSINVPVRKLAMFRRLAESGGIVSQMLDQGRVLAVPEAAVIDTGTQTIVYRETTPGVFEGVLVKLGPRMTGPHESAWFPVLSGLAAGERVVGSGAFLVDAETRLNPAMGSIYFGGGETKASAHAAHVRPSTPEDQNTKLKAALDKLSPEDRTLVAAQQFCPILPDNKLGSMGEPIKLMILGEPVFVCCEGCKQAAVAKGAATVAKAKSLREHAAEEAAKKGGDMQDKASPGDRK